jgi:hypothetical protein
MGLADFLAQAGRGTVVGNVAQAFGGQTTGQQTLNDQAKREHDFVNNQLPALLQEIHANTDENQIRPLGSKFMLTALQAGIPLKGAENLMEKVIGPALNGVRQEGLNKLRDQYAAQPGLEASPRPEASPSLVKGPDVPATPALPERPLDLNFMMKFGQLNNANPEQFNKMLETPATIAGKQASTQKTQGEIDKETQAQKAIKGLPNIPGPNGEPSQQAVATINRPGITQFLPTKEDSQSKQDFNDQMLKLKEQGMQNQLDLGRDRIAAANDRADTTTDRNRTRNATVLRKEFTTLSKNFRDVGDSYNRIDAATKSNDPMSQVAAIYNFIKMQDPNIVTGSEFNLIQNARPLLAKYGLQSFERAWSGKRLDPEQVTQLRNSAKNLYDASARQHEQRVQEYTRLAEQSDINPRDVITEMGVAPAAPAGQGGYSGGAPSGSGSGSAPTGQGAGAPAVGTISKGYRFKGGNPADRNSWEKVQ